jgi:hypothetical protein
MVIIVGDWRLSAGLAEGSEEAREEQLFLVMLVSQMAKEVLEAYVGSPRESVLAALHWPDVVSGGAAWPSGIPAIDLGPLRVEREIRQSRLVQYAALTLGLRAAVGSVSAPTGLLIQLETNDVVFTSVFGALFNRPLFERSAVVVGLSATYDGRFWSVGGMERFAVAVFPRIDLHGSVEGGFRIQSKGGTLTTRGVYAARVEMGTGLAFVGIGCTWEHVSKGANAGRSGLVVTSTLTWYDLGFFGRPTR